MFVRNYEGKISQTRDKKLLQNIKGYAGL